MDKQQVLYVFTLFDNLSGGTIVAKRNLQMLQSIFGKNNIYEYYVQRKNHNKIQFLITDLKYRGFFGYDDFDRKQIHKLIEENQIGILYIDTSCLGELAEYAKKQFPGIKVITFFHNIEFDFYRMNIKLNLSHSFWQFYRIIFARTNELLACNYSDIVISLNDRDAIRLKQLYGRDADFLIPVCLKSEISNVSQKESCNALHPQGLFFGSNFPPNQEAVDILINKILPKTNIQLVVAGSGMEKLSSRYKCNERVEILGFVENVDDLYKKADFVILPIYSGAGMKVKTAEALKYGKNIIASKEAVEGYDLLGIDVSVCNTIDEFVDAINNFDYSKPRFNQASRNRFLEKYSYEVSLEAFKKVIQSLN